MIEETANNNITKRTYHSPLFNKTTLKVSDLKNSQNKISSNDVSRQFLPPKISSKTIEKNSFNDNLIKFSRINGNPRLDTFLQTYDRIANSIRIGFGNKQMIPKKKRIAINKKYMHELANNKINPNVSLNVNPCITMKPLVNVLLKSVEVVVNEKSKSGDDKDSSIKLIENDGLLQKQDININMTESPQQQPSTIQLNSEKNEYSEELSEPNSNILNIFYDTDKKMRNNEKILIKRPSKESNSVEKNENRKSYNDPLYSIDKLKKTFKDENKNKILDSKSFRQIYDSISHDINVIDSITKPEKDLMEPTSYLNDQSETLFITNQNIEINEDLKLEENSKNINGILFRTDSMSKLYKDIMNNNELSNENNTIDKITLDKTLVSDTPLKKEIHSSNPKDYSLSEVFSYSKSSETNNSRPLHSHGKPSLNNEKTIAIPSHPPSILRRNSSLSSRKDLRNKFGKTQEESKAPDSVEIGLSNEPEDLPLHSNDNANSTHTSSMNDESGTIQTNEIIGDKPELPVLPLIPRRRSSISRKHQSSTLPMGSTKMNYNTNNDNISKSNDTTTKPNDTSTNPSTVPSQTEPETKGKKENKEMFKNYMMFSFDERYLDKRHSVDTANINKTFHDVDGTKTPTRGSPKNSAAFTTPKNKYSPKSDGTTTPPNKYNTPKSSKRHTISPLSIEIPDRPEHMVKHKSSRMSKTLSIIKSLSPKTSSSHMSKKSSKSDFTIPDKNDLVLPSKILFDDDHNDQNLSPASTKNKRFSISKLKNKVIKKASRDNYRKSKDFSVSPEKIHRDPSEEDPKTSLNIATTLHTPSTPTEFEPGKKDVISPLHPLNHESNDPNRNVNPSPLSKSNFDPTNNRRISHPLIQRTNIPSSPLAKAEDDNKSSFSASSFEIIKHDLEEIINNSMNHSDDLESELKIEDSLKDIFNEPISGKEEGEGKEELILEDDGNEEWIDESEFTEPKSTDKKTKKEKEKKTKLHRGKNSASLASRPRNRSLKYGLEGNASLLTSRDKRDLSHGSIHYARSTNKYKVIKPRSIKNGSPKVSPNPVSDRNSSLILLNSSPLARTANVSFSPNLKTTVVGAEPTTSSTNPNQSFILSKGDVSFSSMSVVSKASSVKLRRKIIKKFLHINLRKKRQPKSTPPKKKTTKTKKTKY